MKIFPRGNVAAFRHLLVEPAVAVKKDGRYRARTIADWGVSHAVMIATGFPASAMPARTRGRGDRATARGDWGHRARVGEPTPAGGGRRDARYVHLGRGGTHLAGGAGAGILFFVVILYAT